MTMNLPINRDGVKALLPHRDPMLFIDEVTDFGPDWIKAVSDVDPKAPFFKGHFPDRPIMPGVLLIETIAQAGALIIALSGSLDAGQFIAFSGVESAKFRKPVKPGDRLTIDAKILKSRAGFYKFEGAALIEGATAVDLKFSATQMRFEG